VKRSVFVASAHRYVTVEDGTVRDLDGNELGFVGAGQGNWFHRPAGSDTPWGPWLKQSDALAALLRNPLTPAPGSNRYDKHLSA